MSGATTPRLLAGLLTRQLPDFYPITSNQRLLLLPRPSLYLALGGESFISRGEILMEHKPQRPFSWAGCLALESPFVVRAHPRFEIVGMTGVV
jgi:hypothetical protein